MPRLDQGEPFPPVGRRDVERCDAPGLVNQVGVGALEQMLGRLIWVTGVHGTEQRGVVIRGVASASRAVR